MSHLARQLIEGNTLADDTAHSQIKPLPIRQLAIVKTVRLLTGSTKY
jgi:hypothetical protein